MASQAQINFIRVLADEREFTPGQVADIEAKLALDLDLHWRAASELIEAMKTRPKKAPLVLVDVTARPFVTEEGFYESAEGIFKVVRTRDGERLYAKKSTPAGWDFESGQGMMRKLFADQKLTGEQLAAKGITFGFCIVCSTTFEDPTSKHIGIGPKCGENEMGKDAYKALRATVADKSDVIAFEAKKKADAKARREAKKLAEAQLVLV